jgi:hypothetical protein
MVKFKIWLDECDNSTNISDALRRQGNGCSESILWYSVIMLSPCV